jgi:hypothetical protein
MCSRLPSIFGQRRGSGSERGGIGNECPELTLQPQTKGNEVLVCACG